MTMGRQVTRGDERPVTIIEDRVEAPVVTSHAAAEASETEVVTSAAGPFDLARGWGRFLQTVTLFTLLVVESLLAFRLAFALSAANAANGFVEFIYDVTGPLVAPFEGIANESTAGNGVFEPETVIAMGVFALAALILVGLIGTLLSAPSPSSQVVTRDVHAHRETEL